ncbi:2'-5' RNA ligase family protein [Saccharopolyspora cebuensis]|uniref:2'-5' RNA ligase family protein n=1 Tax=Saccharopolyspora cebuensis TaxID=418759 RepID=A0ABV4CP97_9PSEU
MADALDLYFDATTEAEVRALLRRLTDAGVPAATGRPHLTLAAAGSIPERVRRSLRTELRLLSIPDLLLSTVGASSGADRTLLLGAVVDAELLAVHSAVHDVLAGQVPNPSAYHFPGGWLPHCALATGLTDEQLGAGFAALLPPPALRAGVAGVAITETHTGNIEFL